MQTDLFTKFETNAAAVKYIPRLQGNKQAQFATVFLSAHYWQ